jgi:uncharacterized protein YbcV (DUF1398 family)
MHADRIAIAETCLKGAETGAMSFPEIIGALAGVGFEAYLVDYRAGRQTFYTPGGGQVSLDLHAAAGDVAAAFDKTVMAQLIRWAQAGGTDYSYLAFSEKAKAAGCAFYLASIIGRRVVYFGRSGDMHVEHFPQ